MHCRRFSKVILGVRGALKEQTVVSDARSRKTAQENHAWRAIYAEAIAETDPQKLKDKVAAAEAAIFHRLQVLAQNSGPAGEQSSLREAADILLGLKTDVLNYPGWKQK
jgi:hypothetical protein